MCKANAGQAVSVSELAALADPTTTNTLEPSAWRNLNQKLRIDAAEKEQQQQENKRLKKEGKLSMKARQGNGKKKVPKLSMKQGKGKKRILKLNKKQGKAGKNEDNQIVPHTKPKATTWKVYTNRKHCAHWKKLSTKL